VLSWLALTLTGWATAADSNTLWTPEAHSSVINVASPPGDDLIVITTLSAGLLGTVPCWKERGPPLAVSLMSTRVPSGFTTSHSILASPLPSK